MQVRAKTLVITGCQTARRAIQPGDEWLGLMRSFYSSGASTIVLALCDIEAARRFAGEFYRQFDGVNALAAVRNAAAAINVIGRITRTSGKVSEYSYDGCDGVGAASMEHEKARASSLQSLFTIRGRNPYPNCVRHRYRTGISYLKVTVSSSDLLLRKEPGGTCIHVGGQVLPRDGSLDSVADVQVVIEQGSHRSCTHTNALGEFAIHGVPNGALDLAITLSNRCFKVQGLANSEPRMWRIVPLSTFVE